MGISALRARGIDGDRAHSRRHDELLHGAGRVEDDLLAGTRRRAGLAEGNRRRGRREYREKPADTKVVGPKHSSNRHQIHP
jgi:hypothetical protein